MQLRATLMAGMLVEMCRSIPMQTIEGDPEDYLDDFFRDYYLHIPDEEHLECAIARAREAARGVRLRVDDNFSRLPRLISHTGKRVPEALGTRFPFKLRRRHSAARCAARPGGPARAAPRARAPRRSRLLNWLKTSPAAPGSCGICSRTSLGKGACRPFASWIFLLGSIMP